jgi:tetratricopeptide (TPR) repeat protein
LWHLFVRPAVAIQNVDLKSSGRMRGAGRVFGVLTVCWLAFTAHSAVAQWHRAWGRHFLNQTEVSRAEGLSGAFRARRQSDRHEHAAAEAFRHFDLADRWGLAGTVEVKLGLAWCHLLRGEFDAAKQNAAEAIAIAPDNPALRKNLADIERAAIPPPEDCLSSAGSLAEAGRLEDAAAAFEVCVANDPESAVARFNYGGVLRRLGRNDAAIEQLSAAQRLAPEDGDVEVELGLAYMVTGADAAAIDAFKRAIAKNPGSAESRLHLPELIERLEQKQN